MLRNGATAVIGQRNFTPAPSLQRSANTFLDPVEGYLPRLAGKDWRSDTHANLPHPDEWVQPMGNYTAWQIAAARDHRRRHLIHAAAATPLFAASLQATFGDDTFTAPVPTDPEVIAWLKKPIPQKGMPVPDHWPCGDTDGMWREHGPSGLQGPGFPWNNPMQ